MDDLENTYNAMRYWLKPKGFISHQIDFKCHGTSDQWNGHWTYSGLAWKIIRGKGPYLINREPHSTHLRIMEKEAFYVVCDKKTRLNSNVPRNRLAKMFVDMSEDEITTSGAFIQAVRQN